MNYYVFVVLEFMFILIVAFSLFLLIIYTPDYSPDSFTEAELLHDIVILIKFGSLFIGSSVMIYVMSYYKKNEMEKDC